MRYSSQKRLEPIDVHASRADLRAAPSAGQHQALFDRVGVESEAWDRTGSILFVGGSRHEDLAIRTAQAQVRLDRTPSHWSHVAILLHWPRGADPSQVIGAEVALQPEATARQVPERNGVTLFRLSRYLDSVRYPNLAVGMPLLPKPAPPKPSRPAKARTGGSAGRTPPDPKEVLTAAVLNPNRDRTRFPLWDWLGVWRLYAVTMRDNPLAQHVSHPGAGLCEYAYEAVGIDLTPGATAPDTCPETFWSTFRYWHKGLAGSDPGRESVKVWTSLAPDDGLRRRVEDQTLADEFEAARRGSAPEV